MRQWIVLAVILVSSVSLVGCDSLVDVDQPKVAEPMLPIESAQSFGQTFVARHGGLSGLQFWLDPAPQTEGVLRFHLRAEPGAEHELAMTTVSLDEIDSPGFVSFTFEPLRDSHGRYYYAFVTYEGDGLVHVGQGSGDVYRDGALYLDHEPQDAQTAFRLAYNPVWTVLDLAGAALRSVGLIGATLLLYVVPGWALLAWFWPETELSWAEQLALAVGISLALYPLLLLWTDLVGLHLGALNAWIPIVGGLVALIWRYRGWRLSQGLASLRRWWKSDAVWPDVTLLVVLALIFGVRLLVVRTLEAPMWGDSYQHTVIAQLLVDNGGLFHSWEPYAPYESLTVHTGFHTEVALFMWLTRATSVPATIWVGQLLNGLATLTLYPLAMRVAKGRRWAGVGAVVAAGLLSPLPAYYVNWGRYAQLAGQAILPTALWFLWAAFENSRARKAAVLLGGGVLAGMTLSYYRMPFYFLAFAGPWFLFWSWSHWRTGGDSRGYSKAILGGVLLGSVCVFLFAPWFGALSGSNLATSMEKGLSVTPEWERVKADYQIWRNVFWYVPRFLAVGALAAVVWSVVGGHWEPASVALGTLVLSGLVAGRLIKLPGANFMQGFAVIIALYIPVSVLNGWLVGQVSGLLREWARSSSPILVGIILLVSLIGARTQVTIVDPHHILVTRPDTRAMAWIRQNIIGDARFLVEGFRIYDGRSAVGADAGWWIPLYTQRSNTMPPQYALFNEAPKEADYTRRVVDLVAAFEETPPASGEGIRLLCEEGVTHIYVGQGQGEVGAGVRQLFEPQDFLGHPEFHLVYRQDRVYIFAVADGLCASLSP